MIAAKSTMGFVALTGLVIAVRIRLGPRFPVAVRNVPNLLKHREQCAEGMVNVCAGNKGGCSNTTPGQARQLEACFLGE
jgi:hypothetical protein